MLQVYNPRLCRNLIVGLGLFALATLAVVTFITFLTLNADVRLTSLVDEGTVAVVVILMTLLALFNQVQSASIVWSFTMPFALSWVFYRSNIENDILGVLVVLVVVNGVLLKPRLVVIAGVLEFFLFGVSAIVSAIQGQIDHPDSALRAVLINELFILFTTFVMYALNNGMLQVLERSSQQNEQLQRANRNLQTQRVFQQQTSSQLGELATTLAGFFKEQSSTTREQVALVNEVATTAQELDSAARRIADTSLSVATVAEKALHSVEAGRKTAEDGSQAILTLRVRVEDITESVRSLNNQIERIGEVSTIIGEIASETQLLALNATIEAAGAREFGRRFAAVAEEVNRLSRRVTEAVEQIQETVNEITQASVQSLNATEQGLRQAREGSQLVERLTEANNDVINLVNQTSVLATSIATATQEQHTASSQIVGAVRSISGSANELSRLGDKVSEVVTKLEESLHNMAVPDEPNFATLEKPSVDLKLEIPTTGLNSGWDESLTYSTARS